MQLTFRPLLLQEGQTQERRVAFVHVEGWDAAITEGAQHGEPADSEQ